MSRKLIAGFDYVSAKPVRYTAKQWREQYADCRRKVEAGETFYFRKQQPHDRLVAEAYANIPAL